MAKQIIPAKPIQTDDELISSIKLIQTLSQIKSSTSNKETQPESNKFNQENQHYATNQSTSKPESNHVRNSSPLDILSDDLPTTRAALQTARKPRYSRISQIKLGQLSKSTSASKDDFSLNYQSNYAQYVAPLQEVTVGKPTASSCNIFRVADRSIQKSTAKLNSITTTNHYDIPQQNVNNQLMHLKEYNTNVKYLIDSGAEHSVLPLKLANKSNLNASILQLITPDGKSIKTYGKQVLKLQFDNQHYLVSFIVADISEPILGIDFLSENKITINPAENLLQTKQTNHVCINNVQTIQEMNPRIKLLLNKYEQLTKDEIRINKDTDHKMIKHYIKLNTNVPLSSKQHYLSQELSVEVKKHFEELMKQGIVRRSSSPYSSPITVVKKNNGKLRICGDYRKLNHHTVQDQYPLPHIHSFSNQLHGSLIFTKLDLSNAFYQIPMNEDDIKKTAVITSAGLFEFTRMPFGLRTASQTFQRQMDILFAGLNNVFTYIDDLIIHSLNEDDHIEHLDQVLKILQQHGMTINVEKSSFLQNQVDYLSYEISKEGIKLSNEKLNLFQRIKPPSTIGQLRKFQGLLNYFSRTIPKYSILIKPLSSIKSIAFIKQKNRAANQKKMKGISRKLNQFGNNKRNKSIIAQELIILDKEQMEAFEDLKKQVLLQVTLKHPIPYSIKLIEVDSSAKGYGAALYQINPKTNAKELICLASGIYTAKKSVEDTYTCELEGAYKSVKQFSKIIQSSPTTLYTDNKQLYYKFYNFKQQSTFETRRLNTLHQFIHEVTHIEGSKNGLADYLSRNHNENQCLQISRIHNLYLGYKLNWTKISSEQLKDERINKLIELKKTEFKVISHDNQVLYLYTLNKRILIPKSMINHVILTYHNQAHLSNRFIQFQLESVFDIENLSTNVRLITRSCQSCQQAKIHRYNRTPFTSTQFAKSRFNTIHLDIVGPLLPTLKGNLYCLTIIDQYTKHLIIVPIPNQLTTTIEEAIMSNYIQLFGVPSVFVTDNGTQFTSKEFQKLTQALSIKHRTTIRYHPESNGILERTHRKIKDSIRCLSDLNLEWDVLIPIVQLTWNNASVHQGIYSPNQLLFGTQLVLPCQLFERSNSPITNSPDIKSIEQFMQTMLMITPPPQPSKTQPLQLFRLKDMETCEAVFVKNHSRDHKLQSTFKGPYKVINRSANYYTILIDGKQIPYSINDLKPHYVPTFEDDCTRPAIIRSTDLEQNVQSIMLRRKEMQKEMRAFQQALSERIELFRTRYFNDEQVKRLRETIKQRAHLDENELIRQATEQQQIEINEIDRQLQQLEKQHDKSLNRSTPQQNNLTSKSLSDTETNDKAKSLSDVETNDKTKSTKSIETNQNSKKRRRKSPIRLIGT